MQMPKVRRLADSRGVEHMTTAPPAPRLGRRARARWALGGYLLGIVLARGVTVMFRLRGAGAHGGLMLGRLHIHHALFGLAILLFLTLLWTLDVGVDQIGNGRLWRATAAVWGFSWALVLDELALLLHLRDVYWLPAGEESLYALAVVGVLLAGLAWRAPP
ncbi:hypothetical protein BH10ACT3_BH10ACT3_24500 [soil metagenome]